MTWMEARLRLAAGVHKLWIFWMKRIFAEGVLQADGTLLIPAEVVSRYRKYMSVKFEELGIDYQQVSIIGAEILVKELK